MYSLLSDVGVCMYVYVSVWFSQGKTEASKRVMSFLIDADREISMSSARDRKARNVDALKSRGDYIRKVSPFSLPHPSHLN